MSILRAAVKNIGERKGIPKDKLNAVLGKLDFRPKGFIKDEFFLPRNVQKLVNDVASKEETLNEMKNILVDHSKRENKSPEQIELMVKHLDLLATRQSLSEHSLLQQDAGLGIPREHMVAPGLFRSSARVKVIMQPSRGDYADLSREEWNRLPPSEKERAQEELTGRLAFQQRFFAGDPWAKASRFVRDPNWDLAHRRAPFFLKNMAVAALLCGVVIFVYGYTMWTVGRESFLDNLEAIPKHKDMKQTHTGS